MMIKNLFFPPKCMVCKKVLPVTQHLPFVCKACKTSLPEIPIETCATCGKPKDASYGRPFCTYCTKDMVGITAMVAPFLYQENMRRSILDFKFHNRSYSAQSYAVYVANRIQMYHLENAFSAIVPVPISKKRKRKRGYHQTLLLAKGLSSQLNLPVLDILHKVKDTPPQSSLRKAERVKNLKDVFCAVSLENPPRSVLLVDDIYTTGSTVKACATALRKAGISKIYVAAVAYDLPFYTDL